MKAFFSLIALACLLGAAAARDVPANLRAFHDRIKHGQCTGGRVLQNGFYSEIGDSRSFAYCQDDATKAIYLHGDGTDFADMDIDCDGDQTDPGDGRCGSSADTQSQTAFKAEVQFYSQGAVSDLNANYVPYVVFGNSGSRAGYTNFDPTQFGVHPLSVMAVVCGDKLVYGVWGDVNGDDSPPLVGESSLALATACYGNEMNGDSGHDTNDVLYIAFPAIGDDTLVEQADWGAKNFEEFEATISATGDLLVSKLS